MVEGPTPEEWSRRYLVGRPPWDLGAPHPELEARLTEDPRLGMGGEDPLRAFVPGAGTGHDAERLARAGWEVVAIDVAPVLAEPVSRRLRPLGGRFLVADALAHADDRPFDLLFEHTFFCAIPPARRPEYGEMARRLVRPRGRLAAVVFPVGKGSGGPPWPMTTGQLAGALGDGFRLLEDRPVSRRGHGDWGERWAAFLRAPGA